MIAYGHSDLSAQLGVHLDLEDPKFKAAVRRIALDAMPTQARAGIGGDRGADQGILAARVQGAEPAGERCEHLSRRDESARARAHARLKSIGVPTP